MANIDVTPVRIGLGGNDVGEVLLRIPATIKAAQNDTITILGYSEIKEVMLYESGAPTLLETWTASGNVITLTSANAGATETVRGLVVAKL